VSFRLPQRGTSEHPTVDDTILCIGEDWQHYGKEYAINVMRCPVCDARYECVSSVYRFCPHCGVRFNMV